MKLGFFTPIDRQCKGDREGGHVAELDSKKRRCSHHVEVANVEAVHSEGGGEAEDWNHNPEGDAEPTDGAMNAYVVGADQCGLQDEEEDPAGENDSVELENPRANGGGVDEEVIDGVAEAVHDDCGDQEGHGEVEIASSRLTCLVVMYAFG